MIPAFLEFPFPVISSPAPYCPRLPPPCTHPTILPMGTQIGKLFNLINCRVTEVILCYLESLILDVTYPLWADLIYQREIDQKCCYETGFVSISGQCPLTSMFWFNKGFSKTYFV